MGGCVVVMPPSVARKLPKGKHRIAMVSGWGLDASARYRYKVDAVIPLSDHADYPELLGFVEQVKPRRVFTVHGYTAEFAAVLRARGVDAWSLSGADQLELSLGGLSPPGRCIGLVGAGMRDVRASWLPPCLGS